MSLGIVGGVAGDEPSVEINHMAAVVLGLAG